MLYAKLNNEKKIEIYPYTLTDLRIDTPNTSFPHHIDEDTALFFGVVPVKPTVQPKENYRINLERIAVLQGTEWVEEWVVTSATQEQIAKRTATKETEVRSDRNERLAACDWTQLPDAPVDHTVWTAYRQELRDATTQTGFPWDVVWPVAP